MGTEYRIDLKTKAGVKVAEFTGSGRDGFLDLAYTKRVNEPGLLTFHLNGDNPDIAKFEDKGQVEVWRRNPAYGLPTWTRDFSGLWLAQRRAHQGLSTFRATCPGDKIMLGWRINGFRANTANRSLFTNVRGETVMKTLVNYNLCAAATTANGRLRVGTIPGLSIATDLARGNLVYWPCAFDTILTSLQKLADIAGGDFDLVKTGAQTWQFEFYPGQLGQDLSSTLTFSLGYDNMGEPVYELDHINEKTVAIIGGPGRDDVRTIEFAYGRDYVLTDNDIEVFVNASTEQTTAARAAVANATLVSKQAQEGFSYKVLQTPASFYGVHYGLGYLVTANYDPIEVVQKVQGVTVSFMRGEGEEVEVEMQTV